MLNREKVPYTIFIGGKFIKRNQKELSELAKSELVEIESHAYNHVQHMERLSEKDIAKEVRATKNSYSMSLAGSRSSSDSLVGTATQGV